jgi:hypothetical protein
MARSPYPRRGNGTLLRAFRWLVAVLVLALAPMPVAAATLSVDDMVLVAPPPASRPTAPTRERASASVQPSEARRATRVSTASTRPSSAPRLARRLPLYLRHCAFLC